MALKYNPGDVVGSFGMVLLERTRKDHLGKWLGLFSCGRQGCDGRKEAQLCDVASDHTTSCGCRQLAARRENGRKSIAKIPLSVLRSNGARSAAAMNKHPATKAARVQNGRKSIAKMPMSVRQATGRRNAVAMNKHPATKANRSLNGQKTKNLNRGTSA